MKFLVFQVVPIASYLFRRYNWEQSGSVLCTPSHQVFIHIDKSSPDASFLLAEQSQFSLYDRCSNISIIFVALCWTHASVYSGESSNTAGAPDLSSQVLSRWQVPPSLTSSALPCAAQDAVGLCCQGALLDHVKLGVHQDPKGCFCCFPAGQPGYNDIIAPKG